MPLRIVFERTRTHDATPGLFLKVNAGMLNEVPSIPYRQCSQVCGPPQDALETIRLFVADLLEITSFAGRIHSFFA